MKQFSLISSRFILLAGLSLLGLTGTKAYAQIGPTFNARISVDLCPEFRFGGVALELAYSVGADPTTYPATISAISANANQTAATVDFVLPSHHGTQNLNVVASCRNLHGFSPVSNALSISNCDNLAQLDTDGDGMPNSAEDTNCDNFFSPGDLSNPDNVDSDGDGVRDLVEALSGSSATNPGSSPRPYIFSAAVFDPDNNGNANPVVWRQGDWYIRDFFVPGNHLSVPFGLKGDIPFTYTPRGSTSNVGAIRNINNNYHWFFRPPGFQTKNGGSIEALTFGLFGDNIILGPWEEPGVTSPAVARLFNGVWSFFIYLSDGRIRSVLWGGNGDIPKPQDYDGDGIYDIAVFRPSEQKTFIIRSSDGQIEIYEFGTGTADHSVRGDYSGDGIDDITFWEPINGQFSSLTSNQGFNTAAAKNKNPNYYAELQLGLFVVHLPLNWNRQAGRLLYTVVDHSKGVRYFRANNTPNNPVESLQWGLAGDAQG